MTIQNLSAAGMGTRRRSPHAKIYQNAGFQQVAEKAHADWGAEAVGETWERAVINAPAFPHTLWP
jgi:hypothetical protein